MLIFNCTKAAQDFFTITRKGEKKTIVVDPPCKNMEEDSQYLTSMTEKPLRIQQWVLHVVSIKRKQCLVAVEANTRFSVILVGIKKADSEDYLATFKAQLSSQVLGYGEGLNIWQPSDVKKIIKGTLNHFSEAHFFRRYDRSVQARINSVVSDLRYWADVDPTILTDEHAMWSLNYRFNSTLCKSKAYPEELIIPMEKIVMTWLTLYQNATSKKLDESYQIMRAYEREKMGALVDSIEVNKGLKPELQELSFDTNKPNLMALGVTPLSDEDITFLDAVLCKYRTESSQESVSSLHGFLTAIVSGPNMLLPSQWLPEVWGGHSMQPEWETLDEMNRFMEVLFNMMNETTSVLMNTPQQFCPMFLQDENSVVVSDWCMGYIDGVELDGDAWNRLPERLVKKVMFLHRQVDSSSMDSYYSDEQQADQVIEAARLLHAYCLEQRMPAAQSVKGPASSNNVVQLRPVHPATGKKVGRNELCPCGSGKKFKKCCLH